MPLISKPNYNQIFASQAPEQDKPAVFNNYPEGWGPESRPNNGKPTIKGFNYLQQTSDLKDLWILQNGACLPYDESIEYAEGAPVLKDGVIQYKTASGFKSRDSVTIPTYNSAADGVDPVTGVAEGAYFNVRSSSDESYIDEYQNVGGSAVATGKSYPSSQALTEVKQNQIEQGKKIGEIAVKFLLADEIGLTKWTDFKKPPYTALEYEQAYNNGVRLTSAIKAAHDSGYGEVVLERGNYPMCYSRLNNSSITDRDRLGHAVIDGVSDMDVNLNGSVLFTIFDSTTRSPYDAATTSPAYQLPGCIIGTKNSRNVTLLNGKFRGDQFMRSWVSGEQSTEQTMGYLVGTNTDNFKVEDCSFFGFRGDGVKGINSGTPITGTNLDNWYKGGLSSTGVEVEQVNGSYRSNKMDIRTVPIIDNSIQFQTLGSLQAANFRNDVLDIYFFDESGAFISKEAVRQVDNIYLPVNCKYVQIVAYDDERTDPTVSYGLYLFLATGTTLYGEVTRCEFYANHRGGIANLSRRLLVDNCDFHDIGTTKYGFPTYGDPTRYCINFEDNYNDMLVVRNTNMRNSGSGILCNARNLQVLGGAIKDMQYGAFGLAATSIALVEGVTIENTRALYSFTALTVTQKRDRIHSIKGCVIKDVNFYADVSAETGLFLDVSDNVFDTCLISLAGSGKNIQFNDNTLLGFNTSSAGEPNGFFIYYALSCSGNSVVTGSNLPSSSGIVVMSLKAEKSSNNLMVNNLEKVRIVRASANYPVVEVSGIKLVGETVTRTVSSYNTSKAPAFNPNHVDMQNYTDLEINNIILQLGETADRGQLSDNITVIKNLDTVKSYIGIARNETSSATKSSMSLIIKDSNFNLTDVSYCIRILNAISGPVDIQFINCDFTSDTPKSISLVTGTSVVNITATAINCRFNNITDTGNVLQIKGTAKTTYDPPSLTNGVQQSTTVTLTGAKIGDNVSVSFDKPLSGTRMWGEVTSANTVTIYHRNDTGAVVDVPSGTLTVKIV